MINKKKKMNLKEEESGGNKLAICPEIKTMEKEVGGLGEGEGKRRQRSPLPLAIFTKLGRST